MRSRIFGLSFCALAAPALAQEPQWLTDARAREAKLLPRERKLEAPDDWFTTRTPLRPVGKVSKDDDGSYSVSFDMGIPNPIECLVTPDSQDPPVVLAAAADATFEMLATQQGEIEAKGIESVDARAIGDAIAMEIDWFYRVKGADGARVGELHLAYAEKQGAGIYCVKTELGYTRTFRSLFERFVANFERADPPARPAYKEIVITRIGGKNVGVGVFTLATDADGDRKDEQTMHLLVPATSDTLTATTTVDVEWVRGADLSLINAAHVQTQSGEVVEQLNLAWSSEKSRWAVEGKLDGKQLDIELPENAAPVSNLAMLRDLRNALADAGAKGRNLTWTKWSSADPSRLVDATATVEELLSESRALVTQTVGPVRVRATVERETGQSIELTMPVGPAEMKIERVYVHGSL